MLVEDDVLEDQRADEWRPVGKKVIRRQDGESGMTLLPVIDVVHHYLLLNRELVQTVLHLLSHLVFTNPSNHLPHILLTTETLVS